MQVGYGLHASGGGFTCKWGMVFGLPVKEIKDLKSLKAASVFVLADNSRQRQKNQEKKEKHLFFLK
jgi:hypothetical protein